MWVLDLNFGGILREFGEILGKYCILDGRSVGSKGLKKLLWGRYLHVLELTLVVFVPLMKENQIADGVGVFGVLCCVLL